MAAATHELDVVIVGAGLSGLGAAVHLSTDCPDRSFAIFEGRTAVGGTWDLFRYPGVRSDSNMHTLGYRFKPWKHEKSIADGASILAYLQETVEERDLARYIRFGHHVERADWSSQTARWTLRVRVGDDARDPVVVTCRFLYVCAGYYDYAQGYRPEMRGEEQFAGMIVHPQHWPAELETAGSSIAVIGSGATAMSLVPALAETAKHVTMVQRSATYVVAQPDTDRLDRRLRGVLPHRVTHQLTRYKYIWRDQLSFRLARAIPQRSRAALLRRVRSAIGDERTAAHFSPDYDPWDQRLCLLPNGDLFDAINLGSASVVTGDIEQLTADGIVMTSGEAVPADIIVTATGLNLLLLGGIDVVVDGDPVDFGNRYTYRGVGYSGVPNLFSTFGYVNASWTLRADLVAEYVCRVLNHMRKIAADTCVPTLGPEEQTMSAREFIDDFSPGYIARSSSLLPKQGPHDPWTNYQRYWPDRKSLLKARIDDGVMQFGNLSA